MNSDEFVKQNLAGNPVKEPDTEGTFEHAWAKNVHTWDLDQLEPQDHEPYQEGPYIKCKTPGHDHGFFIGPLKQLVERDGKLVIESIRPNHNHKQKPLQSNNTLLYS